MDYANVFTSLEKGLALYGVGKDGKTPVKDKNELVEALRQSVDAAILFCSSNGIVVATLKELFPVILNALR